MAEMAWHEQEGTCRYRCYQRSFHLPYASKEGFGILQKQWLSLVVVHRLVLTVLRGCLKTWYFVCNLRVDISEKLHGGINEWLVGAL